MNILYTTAHYGPGGSGTAGRTHELARRLAGQGHRVAVACLWQEAGGEEPPGTMPGASETGEAAEIDGVEVYRLAISRREKLGLPPWWAGYGARPRSVAGTLEAKLRAPGGGWDVVHHVGRGPAGLGEASLALARSLGAPFVLTPAHPSLPQSPFPPHISRLTHYALRITHYALRITHYALRITHYASRLPPLEHRAGALIAMTEAEKESLAGLGVERERIHVTGAGPLVAEAGDPERFRRRYGLAGEPVILLRVGTGEEERDRSRELEAVLAAARLVWRRCPAARFVFAGPETRRAVRLFDRHVDLRQVRLGPVDVQTWTDALAACVVLCAPSPRETSGAVYTEAWALGRPAIAGECPAGREVVADGVDGFVARQDPADIATRILALLDDPALARRMGEAGRSKLRERYNWDRLAGLTLQVYAQVIEKG